MSTYSENTVSSTLKNSWETYTSAWKAETAEQQRALFEKSLAANCRYTDPTIATQGWDELQEYMLGFHQQVPGGHFVTQSFSSHHQQSLASWKMLDGNGNTVGEGTSHGRYNDDGKLLSMTGFFEVQG